MNLLGALAFSLLARQNPAADHWKFEGTLADAGPRGRTATAIGRVAYAGSPIGPGGKALWLNGVDAAVQIPPFEDENFTISAWVYPFLAAKTPLLARAGWTLEILPDGALQLGSVTTPGDLVPPGKWTHVAVALGRTAGARLIVNGEAKASGDGASGSGPLLLGRREGDKVHFQGLVDELRLQPGIVEPADLVRAVRDAYPEAAPKPFTETPLSAPLSFEPGEIVVFTGGANAVAARENAFLETLLTRAAAGKDVRFRNMAWEGDTVFEQRRDLNFPSWRRELARAGATMIVAQFGQLESLEGEPGLSRFVAAYDKLLEDFRTRTRRLVLVSPLPFERPEPPLPDQSPRNADVRRYAEAIRGLAAKHAALFVDLAAEFKEGPRLTWNGVHLTGAGHAKVAEAVARRLGVRATPSASDDALRAAIGAKNQLWFDHWRPQNWAFLNGDRTSQPSSRDHQDPRIRWFPAELQEFLPLLRAAETRIAELAR